MRVWSDLWIDVARRREKVSVAAGKKENLLERIVQSDSVLPRRREVKMRNEQDRRFIVWEFKGSHSESFVHNERHETQQQILPLSFWKNESRDCESVEWDPLLLLRSQLGRDLHTKETLCLKSTKAISRCIPRSHLEYARNEFDSSIYFRHWTVFENDVLLNAIR